MTRLGVCLLLLPLAAWGAEAKRALYFARANAGSQPERTRIANVGIAIDGVFSDSVTFLGTEKEIARVRQLGFDVEVTKLPERSFDFPPEDRAFHDYKEMLGALDDMQKAHPDIVQRITVGKSLEGRELAGVRLSSHPEKDSLPTALFMGCHHAREHLSVEVPLKLAQYLVDHYSSDARIKKLLDTREVWIVPMVNPDGAEYDIASGDYRYWRKNRSHNADGSYGVDLNRNYGGPNFGGDGSSDEGDSETYHGPKPFSEPETQAMRDFIRARKKATTLLTFHTFSELVLWPWGYTNDDVSNDRDVKVFEAMGNKIAEWNHYTAEKSSALYLTAGDTTDWAYDELKMFAFTIELTPSSMFEGGFYPGAKAIQPTFDANLEPSLYLIEYADNPYRVLDRDPSALVD